MWRKNGAAALESSLADPQNTGNISIQLRNSTLRYILERNENTGPHTKTLVHEWYSSFIQIVEMWRQLKCLSTDK